MPYVSRLPNTHEGGYWGTINDAAEFYSVSPKTIRRMAFRGEIIARRFGPRLIRIWLDDEAGRPLHDGGDAA